MADSSLISGFRTGFGSAFLQFAFERFATFGSFAWEEISVIWGVEDELRKLQRTSLKIQDLVDRADSSELRFSNGSKAWKMWFEDLRKLAYDADALLDHVTLHISFYCAKSPNNVHQADQVRSMILSSLQLDLPHEMKEMQKSLEDLANEMKSLLLIEKVELGILRSKTREKFCSSSGFVNMTSLLVDDGTIVGREEDKRRVLKLIENTKDDVDVIPIVGMGGIGKTILAQLVYNDKGVCDEFEHRIWLSVSVELDMVRITKGIIECVTKEPCALSDLNSLQLKLEEILKSPGKFLIVLDDYWSEIQDEWSFLFAPIRSGSKGSKIIVTTRSMKASNIVGSVEPYELQILSDPDCWSLMKKRAFPVNGEIQDYKTLGEKIAEKCKGLPLAAKTIGSVLRFESTIDKWQSILKCELWDLPVDQNAIFPCLMLSYLHLPVHLRKCFAYCSIFPQNHEFIAEELVLLWMAEGFIQPIGGREPEEIGNDYLKDLYHRSFFQREDFSNQSIYKMHGLIHNLAQLVSSDICVRVKNQYPLFGNVCHLSLHNDYVQSLELKASHKNERLRTFLVIGGNAVASGVIDEKLFSNLKFVRVLDFSYIGLVELPDSINKLIYLRYLNLCGNKIARLPHSICQLLALQTLKLLNNPDLVSLPKDLKSLSSLRHLCFDLNGKLSCMPHEFGKLTSLRSLSAFIVSKRKGHHIEELMKMDSLSGSLSIMNLDNVESAKSAMNAKLGMKPYLSTLCLQWKEINVSLNPQDQSMTDKQQAPVFENLKPHENLKELAIKNYCGFKCPSWLSDSSRIFTSIHLEGLAYCDMLPCFGKLPSLKFLCIKDINSVKNIDHTFYGDGNSTSFPLLESLEVSEMKELVYWEETRSSNTSMPLLSAFVLDGCPNLTSLPLNLRSLRNSRISRCPHISN